MCRYASQATQKAEVKFCILLRKYRNVTLVSNEASAYTQCSQPLRKLNLTAMQLKFSQINLKMMAIQKIGKYTFCSN